MGHENPAFQTFMAHHQNLRFTPSLKNTSALRFDDSRLIFNFIHFLLVSDPLERYVFYASELN